ncbi:hypothetical protein QBZ16_005400 [Prototheca wickerhamii]|uniref:GST N-terminal domain-containing protein n=1 Tax=Prototheca wickerhamii TaxID=3111 RepID=A0AAD9IHB8_PROWI|nr:hypothetical protein QBZ16_005400 [Prototheca wickerhamii]
MSILDLEVLVFPCPKGGPTWREKVKEMGGKAQFPYMVDPNTGTSMYDSDAILQYLFSKYGPGSVPLSLRLGPLTTLTETLAVQPSMWHGVTYRPSRLPKKPLVLWSFEPSPFCKIVQERLTQLEIPYFQVATGRGSPKKQRFFDIMGTFQAPYLEDPNEGVAMFESAAILQYLEDTYAIKETAAPAS